MNPSSNWFAMCQPGEQLTGDDVRPIDVDADDTLRAIPADRLSTIVGQYAKVRLVAGSLVVTESLQGAPLVSSGAAVVAIQVPDGALPIGLRERSPVELVVPVAGDGSTRCASDHRELGVSSACPPHRRRRPARCRCRSRCPRHWRRRSSPATTSGWCSSSRAPTRPTSTPTTRRPRAREPRRDRRRRRHHDDACARRGLAGERRRAGDRSGSHAAGHSPRGSTSRSPRRCRRW